MFFFLEILDLSFLIMEFHFREKSMFSLKATVNKSDNKSQQR